MSSVAGPVSMEYQDFSGSHYRAVPSPEYIVTEETISRGITFHYSGGRSGGLDPAAYFRQSENYSPGGSVCSNSSLGSSSGYSSSQGGSPPPSSSPSPLSTTPSKLYNLLKQSASQDIYRIEDVWDNNHDNNDLSQGPGSTWNSQPIDLSQKNKRRRVHTVSLPYPIARPCSRGSVLPNWSPTQRVNSAPSAGPSILQNILSGAFSLRSLSAWNDDSPASVWDDFNRREPVHVYAKNDNVEQSLPSENTKVTGATSKRNEKAVTLAKKNLYPVTARVSDWIMKVLKFCQAISEFQSLPPQDMTKILLSSWSRLLLLQMAEANFEFAVSPCAASHYSGEQNITTSPEQIPTMSAVEQIQGYIARCQTLNLDHREYHYLQMITLFSSGTIDSENSQYVDNVSACARQALQDHVTLHHSQEKMRYSKILLTLPTLYGINCKVIETLFCKNLQSDSKIEVLLKEMLLKQS